MSDWRETNEGLYKRFEFKDFQAAFAFMERVAELAEAAGHHPDWKNSYNTVEIWLLSHDTEDAITEKDRMLAAEIDRVTV